MLGRPHLVSSEMGSHHATPRVPILFPPLLPVGTARLMCVSVGSFLFRGTPHRARVLRGNQEDPAPVLFGLVQNPSGKPAPKVVVWGLRPIFWGLNGQPPPALPGSLQTISWEVDGWRKGSPCSFYLRCSWQVFWSLSFLVLFIFPGGLQTTKFFATIPRVEMFFLRVDSDGASISNSRPSTLTSP